MFGACWPPKASFSPLGALLEASGAKKNALDRLLEALEGISRQVSALMGRFTRVNAGQDGMPGGMRWPGLSSFELTQA